MKRTINPLTGNQQIQTSGRLVQISETVLTNVNGTKYRIATVEDCLTDKGPMAVSGIAWESNVQKGAHIGEHVLVTFEKTNLPEPLITVSTNIVTGVRPDNSVFNWDKGTFVPPNARQVARAQERAAQMGIEPAWKGQGRDVRALKEDQIEAPVSSMTANQTT
jgi:hypothetical protein